MRRFHAVSACLLACVSLAAPVGAQPRPAAAPAYVATVVGSDLPAGLGVVIPVRIADARSDAPAVEARVSAARLVSPFGAVTPVQPPPEGAATALSAFRADLLSPGGWTLEFTLASSGRPAERETVGFTVAAQVPAPTPVDPAGAAATAAGASLQPLGPSAVAPGPGAPGEGVFAPPTAPSTRTAGDDSPPATPITPPPN